MTTSMQENLLLKIRAMLVFFICALILSGITAFPIETQLAFGVKHISFLPETLQVWIVKVYEAVKNTNSQYPFLSYGTDWLAFAHIVIAVAFIGPYQDPVRNIWVIKFGMIACIMIFPLAIIAGHIRQIPVFWRIIDCSFGFFGIIPLMICHQWIKKLENIQNQKSS